MSATIMDITKKLGISTSAVSYALNGGPRRVPIEVADHVRATALELGYQSRGADRLLSPVL